MKINTDAFPVSDTNKEPDSQSQKNGVKRSDSSADTVTITAGKKLLVTEENKAASNTDLKDIKQAEKAVGQVKGMLLNDIDTVSDIHQLGEKSIVSILKGK